MSHSASASKTAALLQRPDISSRPVPPARDVAEPFANLLTAGTGNAARSIRQQAPDPTSSELEFDAEPRQSEDREPRNSEAPAARKVQRRAADDTGTETETAGASDEQLDEPMVAPGMSVSHSPAMSVPKSQAKTATSVFLATAGAEGGISNPAQKMTSAQVTASTEIASAPPVLEQPRFELPQSTPSSVQTSRIDTLLPAALVTAAPPAASSTTISLVPRSEVPGAAAVPIAGIAVEIAARAFEGKRRFEIRLDPPELGRIDVRLDVGRDGQVTSRLVVERAETLDLLRRDAATLERALQSSGLRTDDAGLQFALRDQTGGRWAGAEITPRPNLLIVPDDDVSVHEAVRRGYGVLRGLGRGIDIRV